MIINRLFQCLLLIAFGLADVSSAKTWRGLTPLHSTKPDVERILGKPSAERNNWSIYHGEDETISLQFSNGLPCGSGGANSEWKVPKGTVISITVAPKKIIPAAALRIPENKYKKRGDPHKLNHVEYLSEEEGESISIVNGEVSSFTYFPAAADSYRRCPEELRTVKLIENQSAARFDNYGDLRFADEKARLDNFAIELWQKRLAKGYIIVYRRTGQSARIAAVRALQAKKYLISARRIKASRLVILIGQPIGEFTVELYIVPEGAEPPTPLRLLR